MGFIIFLSLLVFVTLFIRFLIWSAKTNREKESNNLQQQQLKLQQERLKLEEDRKKLERGDND